MHTVTEKKSALQPYTGLDVFKLFFAVCVVAIHTYAIEGLPASAYFWITQGVFRLAIPFFFVTSGFLLGKKLREQKKEPAAVIHRYIKGLLPPLLCVGIVNGIFELLLRRLRYGTDFRSLMIRFVKAFVFYPYGAMWYVQACIIGVLILYPFLKKGRLNPALLLGALLYGWALLCNNYYFLAEGSGLSVYVDSYMDAFMSARNGVFVGFFYLALGIKTYEWHQKDLKAWKLKWGLIGLAVIYLLEIYLLKDRGYLDDRAMYLTQIALAPVMVLCILRMKIPISASTSVLLRKASVWIYFSHRLIYVLGRIVCFLTFGGELRGVSAMLIVMVISLLVFFVTNGIKSLLPRSSSS